MKTFKLALRLLSAAFIAVAALHFFTGLQADALLGVPITPAMASDPSIDSQNRFYGITFSLLGVILIIATTDLRRYEPMVIAAFGVLFMAGIARAVVVPERSSSASANRYSRRRPAFASVALCLAEKAVPPVGQVFKPPRFRAARFPQ